MAEPDYVVHQGPHQASRRPGLLDHLDIELTERCNNACIHCCINRPAHDVNAAERELTTEAWKEILRQAASLGALSVRITGGEPLLRPDFPEIYLFARRMGLRVALLTNGRLITPELGELFARVPPLKKVEISVYGMKEESYTAVACDPGAFAEFRRGVDLLLKHKVPFLLKPVLPPPNRAEIEAFKAWVTATPGMDGKPPYTMRFDFRARRDNPAKNRIIESLSLTPDEMVAMLARDPDYQREGRQFAAKFMGPPGDRLFSCGAGQSTCVDAYGKAQMCMLLRHPGTVYDLRDGAGARQGEYTSPLRDALTEFFPRLRQMRAANPEYLRRCARCFLHGLCEQCPSQSWLMHGTLDRPVEYLCRLAHAQARDLGLLTESERAWEIADWRARIATLVRETDTAA